MTKKMYESPRISILLIIVAITTPRAWSKAVVDSDAADLPGPGAAPDHIIPAEPSKVVSWFSKIIKPAKERKGLEPDIAAAEAKLEIIKVRKDGSGKFKTIMQALNTVEVQGNDNRVIIDIGPGVYHERVIVDRYRPYITLYGDPKERPTLLFEANTGKVAATDTATLFVEGDNFVAVNLNIVNSSPRPDATNEEAYGMALRITGNWVAFYNCKIIGFKNTILDDKGRHFFKDCQIEGMDDFIFGDGRSLYLNTELNVLPSEPASIITAQARKNTDTRGGGFVFAHCSVTGTAARALLGRTYMAGSRVIYAYCDMANIVEAKGWSDDFLTDYEKTGFFVEYKNTGPGADTSGRIKLPCIKTLKETELNSFLTLDFIDASEWLLPPPKLTLSP